MKVLDNDHQEVELKNMDEDVMDVRKMAQKVKPVEATATETSEATDEVPSN